MRKFFLIILLLFAAIAVPYANADSITDPNVITKFECCNGARVPVYDLEITFNAPITAFISNLGNGCKTKGMGTGTVTATCTDPIPVGDIIVTTETTTGKFAFAFWTDATGANVATATPTPEPATGGLILLGFGVFGMLMLLRNAQRSRTT